jgi:N-acetylated-alpha-linked acidic dipeptidase
MPITLRSPLPALLILLTAATGDSPRLLGFSAESSRNEVALEARFRDIPSTDSLRAWLRRLSARPHHVGSPYNRDNAEWLVARFKSWGWEASIDTFEVLFPTPKERVVELVAPTKYVAKMQEPAVAEDPTTGQTKEQLPTYNAYSIDGDVTAPLIYVNYGMPADYRRLERMGISVKGAIVLARYGGGWRGLKPKLAADHGAVGCLIYSDPRDDGYGAGDVYPAGAYRPKWGVQRGSVAEMPVESGDPFTPNVGARPGVHRLPFDSVTALTKIPVLPLSYGDAEPLLAALGGRVAPEEWRGGLPMTYHVGPGPAKVHLRAQFNWKPTLIFDVVARLTGKESPDEWILRGNHQDGWVNGADDPLAGLVAELEEARALGILAGQGWKPKRTIVYIAWDAEEPGLVGSTEFVEAHADELRAHAAVYVNSDGNGRGYLGMGGSHSLEALVNEVAREVTDPETGLSVGERLRRRQLAQASTPDDRTRLRGSGDLRIDALGSGSDFTPFLQHLGIASLNLGFGGEGDNSGGVYHSIYDSDHWYERFSDTGFVYGRALAQTAGMTVLRLANADVLPFKFSSSAETVNRYLGELKKLLTDRRDEITERNRQLEDGVFSATRDPREPDLPPPSETVPPFLNFAPFENAANRYTASSAKYDSVLAALAAGDGAGLAGAATRGVNARLQKLEQTLAPPVGLPGRPWFKHQLYAPGLFTGYGVKTVPAVREAIEESHWDQADKAIVIVAETLDSAAASVDAATALLTGKP